MRNNNKKMVLELTQLAMLAGIVVALQFAGSFITIGPLPISLVLVPIVIGASLLGPKGGAVLGATFGIVTMIMGITGIDVFSNLLFLAHPFWFVVLCLLKAFLAGLGSGLINNALIKAFKGEKVLLRTVLASISAPIINTGIFVIGMLLFFYDTVETLPALFPDVFGGFLNPYQLVFIGLAGLNFIGEFIVNLVLSPAIVRIIDVVKKRLNAH